jgi:predicted metalloprotease with PDZ domain
MITMILRSLLAIVASFAFTAFMSPSPSVAETIQSPLPIQYRLSFRQSESHRVDIELTVPTDGKSTIELMMPVWTPGSYLVREYARQIETITASNGLSNAPLLLEKRTKNRWRVECDGVSEVVVRYSLYCREMGVRTNWVERDFAFLTGAATYLTRVDALDRQHIVRLDATPNWPQVATSLAKQSDDTWVRVAKNFDELVDSPIVLGNIDIQSFECGGAKHYLASVGTDGLWNTKAAVKDVQRIVETEQKFWGEVPYTEYWFLNLATESGGGLEHDNSTVLMTSRWTMRQKSKYTDWLALVSHEFFHTWNVRRLRPKALTSYDFENEQYTNELWVAEGVTSYYDDLLLARSGLCSPKEYLDQISKGVAGVQTAPGRLVQPLSQSSFDAWIKFYRPDENANNSRVSYYTKGSLVAMLLDAEIRLATKNAKSLDDVMRQLWKEHRVGGYVTADVLRIANQVSGQKLDAWFKDHIDGTKELDFASVLKVYGLEWKPKESKESTDKKELTENNEKYGSTYVGLDVTAQQGKAMIDKVTKGSPAENAGINSGDELISLDGYRIAAENWGERLGLYRPNEILECIVARRGKILKLPLKLGEQSKESWTLQRIAKPSDEQESAWRNWLQIPPAETAAR